MTQPHTGDSKPRPRDFELLRAEFERQQLIHAACVAQVPELGLLRRLLAQPWLAEIRLQLVQLGRMVAQLEDRLGAPPDKLDTAWRRLEEVIAALSAAVVGTSTTETRLAPVAGRLMVVMSFLALQVTAAAAVLGWVLLTFGRSDPQTTLTREQWEERAAARAEIGHVRLMAEEASRVAGARDTASPGDSATRARDSVASVEPPGPDPAVMRASVEGLVATLTGMRLAERDLRVANRYLENALSVLDEADFAETARGLATLEAAFAGDEADRPVSPIRLIVLGSLLGMLTITIHLNWKFRNRWETVGFLPWYLTRLVAAPVLSLAALGILFQVSFTTDLTAATEFTALGLRGASPLTIFSVAVISGLFSNRVYDWLRQRIEPKANPRPPRPGAAASPAPAAEESAE